MKKQAKNTDFVEVIKYLPTSWEELRYHRRQTTAGMDGITIAEYSSGYSDRLLKLQTELKEGTFRFSILRRAKVEGDREVLIQTVDERILAKSVLKVIHPQLFDLVSPYDFSFRGIPAAVEFVQSHLNQGYIWIFEADIKKFFDNVPKAEVFALVKSRVKNKKVLELIRQIIYFQPESSSDSKSKIYLADRGIVQGSSLSSLLASIYLSDFDFFVSKSADVKFIRYVDDFIVLCKSEEVAKEMYELSKKKLEDMKVSIYALGEVNKEGIQKTKITCAKGSAFDFLGLSFNYTDVDISKKKKDKINKDLAAITNIQRSDFLSKTRRLYSKISGYIEQYKKHHYTRTIPSLGKIIADTEDDLKRHYLTSYSKITGRKPFKGLDDRTIEKLFSFMGINFGLLKAELAKPFPPMPKETKKLPFIDVDDSYTDQ